MPDTRDRWRSRPAAPCRYRPRPPAAPRHAQHVAQSPRSQVPRRRPTHSATACEATWKQNARFDSGSCETRRRHHQVRRVMGFKPVRRQPQTYTGLQVRNRGGAIKSWMKGAEFRRYLTLGSNLGSVGVRFRRRHAGPRILLNHELGPRKFRKTAAMGDKFIESSAFDHAAL